MEPDTDDAEPRNIFAMPEHTGGTGPRRHEGRGGERVSLDPDDTIDTAAVPEWAQPTDLEGLEPDGHRPVAARPRPATRAGSQRRPRHPSRPVVLSTLVVIGVLLIGLQVFGGGEGNEQEGDQGAYAAAAPPAQSRREARTQGRAAERRSETAAAARRAARADHVASRRADARATTRARRARARQEDAAAEVEVAAEPAAVAAPPAPVTSPPVAPVEPTPTPVAAAGAADVHSEFGQP